MLIELHNSYSLNDIVLIKLYPFSGGIPLPGKGIVSKNQNAPSTLLGFHRVLHERDSMIGNKVVTFILLRLLKAIKKSILQRIFVFIRFFTCH